MRKLILFTLLVAWPTSALSQQIYGRLEGAASDAQGLVLPGVTVTLESAQLVAARSATTDVDGSYRFAQLVAGSYNMTFELGGFQTLVFEDITVVGGSTFEINSTMDIATVAETVTVTGESPVVDVKTTGVSATFDTTQLEDVPSATDMWAVLQQSPGVRMRGYDVGGSHKSQQSGYETFGVRGQNRIINDGVNTTEGTGGAGGYYDFYAIGEFQVSAQGADVESNTPGATVNAVWKAGGNEFSGTEHYSYEPPDLIADNITSELQGRGGTTAPVIRFFEYHLDLGGPIVRDKAWFYAAYNRFYIDRIISGQDPDVATDVGDFDMFTVKANWQITERDQFITFHHWSLKQKPFRSLSANVPAESILAQDSWSWLHKSEWQRVWNDRLYSNIQVNHFGFGWPMTPAVDPASSPPRLDTGTSFRTGAGWRPFTFNRWKPHTTGQFNYYLPTESGSHDFKFGWDWQIDEEQFGWNANSGAVRYLDDSGQDPARPHNVNEIHFESFPNFNQDRNTHMDFYAQDVWTVTDRFTLNAGVRLGTQRIGYLGSNNVPAGTCPAVVGCIREIADIDANVAAALPQLFGSGAEISGNSNVISWWNLAPRVGFTYGRDRRRPHGVQGLLGPLLPQHGQWMVVHEPRRQQGRRLRVPRPEHERTVRRRRRTRCSPRGQHWCRPSDRTSASLRPAVRSIRTPSSPMWTRSAAPSSTRSATTWGSAPRSCTSGRQAVGATSTLPGSGRSRTPSRFPARIPARTGSPARC